MSPRFGVIVELRDPIDPTRGDHTGLHRHIYPIGELTAMLQGAAFTVEPTGHYIEYVFPDQAPDRYMLHARRPHD